MRRNFGKAVLAASLCAIVATGCTPAIADQLDGPEAFAAISDRIDSARVGQREAAKREFAMARWNERQEAARAAREAAEAAAQAEAEYERQEPYYEPQTRSYNSYGNSFMGDGVAYVGGAEFNWYSQRDLPGEGLDELNANGRHVDGSTGFVVDGDGYIAVASPWGRDEVGAVVETPFGQGKVYDANEGDAYDLYTDF